MLRILSQKAFPSRSSVGVRLPIRQNPVLHSIQPRLTKCFLPTLSIRYNSQSTVSEIQDKLPSFDTTAISDASNLTSDSLGYLKSIGMGQGWGPTSLMENYFELVHVYTGLPWWATIVTCTIVLRVALLPLFFKGAINNAKMTPIQPKLTKILEEVRVCDSPARKNALIAERSKLMKEHGVSVGKSFLAMAQLPFAYGIFQALRKMANYPVEGFSTQGALWFQDLTEPDPFFGLQGMSALFMVAMLRFGGDIGSTNINPAFRKYLYVFPLVTFCVTAYFSGAVALYVALNSFLSILQGIWFRSKTFRRVYNLPEPPKKDWLKSPASLSEWWEETNRKNRDAAKIKLEASNKKLEAQSKNRYLGTDGFVKKH